MSKNGNLLTASSENSSDYRFVPQLDALGLLRIIYRHWPIILKSVGGVFALGLLYLFLAHPKFTATFLLYIDPRQSQSLGRQEISMNGPPDPGIIESQVEILKSESVAINAARILKKRAKEAGGEDAGPGPIGRMLDRFGLAQSPPPEEAILHAQAVALLANFKAKRLGLTYVIEASYQGSSPTEAAATAQAIADAYVESEMNAKFQATQKATAWMQKRITELRDKASVADRKMLEYKAENNIVDTGRGLMIDQQLGDINSQLGVARAATAEAKARLDRVAEVSNGDVFNNSVADDLHSDIITRLRAQYLDLDSKQAEFATKYGASHGAVQNILTQKQRIKHAIQDELHRISASATSEFEIALSRERGIQEELDKLVRQQAKTSEKQVQLRDLESSAQTYRNIYDTFFQQFEVAVKQQSFPISDARIVTAPFPPDRASSPKAIIIVPISLFLGAVVGFFIALVREFLGNGFRLSDDVLNYAGFECLGILPNLALETAARRTKIATPGLLGAQSAYARHSINAPFTRFTETLRNIKVTVDENRARPEGGVIVGIVSSVPKEGKTTVSANLSQLIAKMGHSTLLIDGDLHNPSLTRTLAPKAEVGLVELLQKDKSFDEVVLKDAESGLAFIPAVVPARDSNVVALLTSRNMLSFLDQARSNFEYVLVDLPPVVPVVDAKAFAPHVDELIFVIEWSATTRDVVREALESADVLRQKVIGCVLNKADPAELKRFEAYKGRYYGSYYIEES
jgi:polysaccharide biosynthesis transport protein